MRRMSARHFGISNVYDNTSLEGKQASLTSLSDHNITNKLLGLLISE
jgi:hypothetical protein